MCGVLTRIITTAVNTDAALVHGLWNKRQLLTYAAVTGLIALLCGAPGLAARWLYPALTRPGSILCLVLHLAAQVHCSGEIAVLIVWGPLMIGGGYYVITGNWSWNAVIASLPYALGVTGVIFGKHIDKLDMDKAKRIHTLPVLLGEKASRFTVVGMLVLQYVSVVYLIIIGYFTPVLLLVFLALRSFFKILPMFRQPKPDEKPEGYPDFWPNYFVASAFVHNREFGGLFLLGLIIDTIIKAIL
jgi:1,4-dihydroxy-2-naphthoate octaprenyltransferase